MGAFQTTIRDGIAWLVFDLPGESVNKITRGVREELDERFEALGSNADVRAIVLASGKPGSFIAGADIDEFVALDSREAAYALVRAGQALINRLEKLDTPVVAAIDGACLGGGLEAVLACTYRIATDHPKTTLGVPEVQLGIIPAVGGCQRLPRLIGVRSALDLILTGKQVPARRAHRLGLVDEVVHPAILERVARQAADRLADGWRPKRGGVALAELVLEKNPVGRKVVFRAARKRVLERTGGHYPAPLAALRAVEHGLRHGITSGLQREAKLFAELAVSPVSRNLVQIFFATTALKKDPGVDGDAPPPREVRNVGVVGAGFMGSAIGAMAALKTGADVRFRDQDYESVGRGLTAARKILDARRKRKRIDEYEYHRLAGLLSGGVAWGGFGRADLVVEAVFESLAVKHEVLRELEEHVPDGCILASNTSTIPIVQIAEIARRPERLLGMHFFSPVEKMPLLEVIVTEQTAPWVTVTAVAFGKAMGKTVIVVRDRPGFWVNRILGPYMNEAGRLLEEGVTIETVDKAMTKFGFPVGPITLLDEVGLDVAVKAAGVMHEAFGERLRPLEGLQRMVDDERFGRKNGRGFYRYEEGKRRGVDESVYEILGASPSSEVPREDVGKRLVYAMLNEAARGVEEGVVRSARDGDIGAIFGIGFPPFRGGPLRYLDELGLSRVVHTLEDLQSRYGDRFAPAAILARLAEQDGRFYPAD